VFGTALGGIHALSHSPLCHQFKDFCLAVPNHLAQTAVGLVTVLSAEVGQVFFPLSLATLGTSPSSRRLFSGNQVL
jgi:hypothetical protein